MATTFQGTFSVGLVGSYVKSADGGDATKLISLLDSIEFTNGTGSNQCNAFWIDLARTLAGTNESHDLNAMTDDFGATLNFQKLRILIVRNNSTTAGQYLQLSGDVLDGDAGGLGPLGGTSPVAYVGPGGIFAWASPIDGETIVDVTKDTLTVTNTVSFTYDLIIGGTI